MSENVHIWNRCHHCEAAPIIGKRFHCETCPDGPDNDLCEPCYQKYLNKEIPHPAEDVQTSILTVTEHCFVEEEGKPAHLFEHWVETSHPDYKAPVAPARFVVRPIFTAGYDSVIGGYAFAVKTAQQSRPILLTALHVMDELIKMKGIDCSVDNENYSGKELPAVVTEVGLYDVFATKWMMAPLGNAGPMLVLPGARSGDEEPFSDRDIAAFYIESGADIAPVLLAETAPGVGEPVWLVAQEPEGTACRLFGAVVVEQTDRSLVFKFEDFEGELKYTSGAPLVNRNGEVVGINVGGGKLKNQKVGHANHSANIRRHLSNA